MIVAGGSSNPHTLFSHGGKHAQSNDFGSLFGAVRQLVGLREPSKAVPKGRLRSDAESRLLRSELLQAAAEALPESLWRRRTRLPEALPKALPKVVG